VTITNDFSFNPGTPSQPTGLATIVTTINCTGSAICPTGGTTTSSTPVTVITQCDNAGLGGASTVTCTVTVTNNLTGYPVGAAIDSTVVQCQSPGAVGTLTCVATPPGNNRSGTAGPGGQRVTQCNASGGAGGTLTCTATAPPSQSTGLPTTIDQCNGSGVTGASTLTCTATVVNNFTGSVVGGGTTPPTGGTTPPTGGTTPPTGGTTPPTGGTTPPTGGGTTPTGGTPTPTGGGTPTPGGTATPPGGTTTPPTGGPTTTGGGLTTDERQAAKVVGPGQTPRRTTGPGHGIDTGGARLIKVGRVTHVGLTVGGGHHETIRTPTSTGPHDRLPLTGTDTELPAFVGLLLLGLGVALRRRFAVDRKVS
jgi:LPXTG-motif cell wall-anchored protein